MMPSVLSLFSRRHRRSPATSPALLLLVATSLSTSAVHLPSFLLLPVLVVGPPSPPFLPRSPSLLCVLSTSDRSLSASASPTVAAFSPSPPPSASSSVVVDTAAASSLSLSSLLLLLRLPDVLLWVISASASLHGFEARRPQPSPPPLPPLLRSFSLLAVGLGPFLSHRCRCCGLLHGGLPSSYQDLAPPPPSFLIHRCRRRLPISPSLPSLPTSDRRGSSSASAAAPSRLRLRPLRTPWTRAGVGHRRLGEDVGVSLIIFSFWAGNGLKLRY